jgi:hypothetical protein
VGSRVYPGHHAKAHHGSLVPHRRNVNPRDRDGVVVRLVLDRRDGDSPSCFGACRASHPNPLSVVKLFNAWGYPCTERREPCQCRHAR